MQEQLIITDDGSHTLKHNVLGELYHSSRGAIGESLHVFINAGLHHIEQHSPEQKISIFEIGFGSGLNGYLTMIDSSQEVDYHSIEKYPIDYEVATRLNYVIEDDAKLKFQQLHSSPWSHACPSEAARITDKFTLTKYFAEIESFNFSPLDGIFDLIYFDAFSPEVQPELWSEEIMLKMYKILKPNGVLVTYSSKGLVKRALRAAGFEVKRLDGALGKRHMLRATKI